MSEKITIGQALPQRAVENVETAWERITRLLLSDINRVTALIVIVVGLISTLVIMIASSALQATAFQLFSTIISAALGFFFGSRSSDR